MNGAAVALGLEGIRDFIVISELCRGEPRTQLALGHAVRGPGPAVGDHAPEQRAFLDVGEGDPPLDRDDRTRLGVAAVGNPNRPARETTGP